MNLLPSEEQAAAAKAVADYLGKELPVTRFHRFPYDQPEQPGLALRKIAELGLFGYGLKESHGGLGGSLVEEMLFMREVGRHVGPLWIYGGCLGARIAAEANKRDVLREILTGSVAVAAAVNSTSATLRVLASEGARYAILTEPGSTLLLDCGKLSLKPLPCLERQLSLSEAPREPAAVVASVTGEGLSLRASVLLASMAVGGAEASRDMAVAYAKVREQFGRPIGSFQAISHLCAEMAMRCEESGAQLAYATLCLQEDLPEAKLQVHSAAMLAIRASLDNARANIQVHGAIAMNEAHEAHYYVKRAHVVETLLGGSARHLDALIEEPAP